MSFLLAVLIFLGVLGISFLVNAGIVWVIVWALKALGVVSIFGWTVAFSWPLVVLFTVVWMVLSGIFKSTTTVKRD